MRRPKAALRIALLSLVLIVSASPIGGAQSAAPTPDPGSPPFRLPFDSPPGPDTWLLLQPYGNTSFAFTFRRLVYGSGQGIHFGIDLAARCGTPVLAIGDGVVSEVDNAYHGAGPHNLMIDHANGYASFYGHLMGRPNVGRGQAVRAGDPVGLTGDPDLTCSSRPHLHLEIRDAPSHTRAYNPIPLIDADWERIALVGGFAVGFHQDLNAPRRWQTMFDQPEIEFGEGPLNNYAEPWPPEW